MARRSESGKYIISAGEVGTFTVCPEAWRLMIMERVKHPRASASEQGIILHSEWASRVQEHSKLIKLTFLIISLLGLAITIHAVFNS